MTRFWLELRIRRRPEERADRELKVFETTMVTHRPPARFEDALSTAEAALLEEREGEFVAAIDVARARMSQILPLATLGERIAVQAPEGDEAAPRSSRSRPSNATSWRVRSANATSTRD